MSDLVEVTQGDRDAARPFMDRYLDGSSFCDDHLDLAAAFARHRLQSAQAAAVPAGRLAGYLTYDEEGRDEEFMRNSLTLDDLAAGFTQTPVYFAAAAPDPQEVGHG